ncbi:hypothetical protein O0L34_g6352 [Tuta absoluta]|nr:hypothetical protein O0L34_g6352 [Tuta absoluta]
MPQEVLHRLHQHGRAAGDVVTCHLSLSHVFEQNALGLILGYLNVRESRDSRLAFEALKYLAALLCHKKFSIDFINMAGLQVMLSLVTCHLSLSHVFEQNAPGLILGYLNVRESRDSRLAFEALKYLAALLCHKKFSIDFINMAGLQVMLSLVTCHLSLSHVFEQNAPGLILGYLNVRESRDSRLAFEALKYLAALLCHKKFSIDFINMAGLQVMLSLVTCHCRTCSSRTRRG